MKMGSRLITLRSPVQIQRLPTTETWGITNQLDDGWFIMLDYDSVDYRTVEEDVKFLQRYYKTGTAMIRTSSLKTYKKTEVGSYHVIFFQIYRSFETVKRIIRQSRCDEHFKGGYKYQSRTYTLRIGPKQKDSQLIKPATFFKKLILSRQRLKTSHALVRFFEVLDGEPHGKSIPNQLMDRNVEIINYATR